MSRHKQSQYILPLPTLKKSLVLKVVNDHFGVNPGMGNRKANLVFQRQATAYLLSVFTNLKNSEIGDAIGYRGNTNHSTISYSIGKVKGYCKFSEEYKKKIIQIESKLEAAYDSR